MSKGRTHSMQEFHEQVQPTVRTKGRGGASGCTFPAVNAAASPAPSPLATAAAAVEVGAAAVSPPISACPLSPSSPPAAPAVLSGVCCGHPSCCDSGSAAPVAGGAGGVAGAGWAVVAAASPWREAVRTARSRPKGEAPWK